jgi:hypothetical protein
MISGIPQGSVLGPLLFVIYINDLPSRIHIHADCSLFADDAKLSKHIKNYEDSNQLQNGFDALVDWTKKWLLKLNLSKCCVLSIGRGSLQDYKYKTVNENAVIELSRCSTTKDLGVVIDTKLSFTDHINEKVNKAYSILGIIKRIFVHIDSDTFVLLYKSPVRSHLEYFN